MTPSLSPPCFSVLPSFRRSDDERLRRRELLFLFESPPFILPSSSSDTVSGGRAGARSGGAMVVGLLLTLAKAKPGLFVAAFVVPWSVRFFLGGATPFPRPPSSLRFTSSSPSLSSSSLGARVRGATADQPRRSSLSLCLPAQPAAAFFLPPFFPPHACRFKRGT